MIFEPRNGGKQPTGNRANATEPVVIFYPHRARYKPENRDWLWADFGVITGAPSSEVGLNRF
jgi:hypothetical protein